MIVKANTLRLVGVGRPPETKYNDMCKKLSRLKPGQAYICTLGPDAGSLSDIVRGIRGATGIPLHIRSLWCGTKVVIHKV